MPVDPVQLLSGAMLGFASAGSLRWWQYRRDIWLSRVEQFCRSVETAADLSLDYWMRSRGFRVKPESVHDDCQKLEAQLIGAQLKLDGIYASFSDRLSNDDQERIQRLMAAFSDGLTGGEFQSLARRPEPDRARLAQTSASDLVVAARSACDRAITFSGWIAFVKERAARRQAWAMNETF